MKSQKPTVPQIAVALREDSTTLPGSFRLEVTGPDNRGPTLHVVDEPFVLIGRAKGCGLRLDHPAVSSRHTYLQAVFGRIYCINLTSRGETLWPDGPRKADWLDLGELVRIGPYQVRLVDTTHLANGSESTPVGFSPLDRYAGQCGPVPKFDIAFLTGAANRTTHHPIGHTGWEFRPVQISIRRSERLLGSLQLCSDRRRIVGR